MSDDIATLPNTRSVADTSHVQPAEPTSTAETVKSFHEACKNFLRFCTRPSYADEHEDSLAGLGKGIGAIDLNSTAGQETSESALLDTARGLHDLLPANTRLPSFDDTVACVVAETKLDVLQTLVADNKSLTSVFSEAEKAGIVLEACRAIGNLSIIKHEMTNESSDDDHTLNGEHQASESGEQDTRSRRTERWKDLARKCDLQTATKLTDILDKHSQSEQSSQETVDQLDGLISTALQQARKWDETLDHRLPYSLAEVQNAVIVASMMEDPYMWTSIAEAEPSDLKSVNAYDDQLRIEQETLAAQLEGDKVAKDSKEFERMNRQLGTVRRQRSELFIARVLALSTKDQSLQH